MVDNASFSASSFVDGEISQMPVPGQRHKVRFDDYALTWILWWRFRKAYAVPGGLSGTDRLGALYECRVIRPRRHNNSCLELFLQFGGPVRDQMERGLHVLISMIHKQALPVRRDVKRYSDSGCAGVEQMLGFAD